MFLKFILILVFIALVGVWYLLSEINITRSSYTVRRKNDETSYFNYRYHEWFNKNETRLLELHEQEFCDSMQLNFDDFCRSIYSENTIIYR